MVVTDPAGRGLLALGEPTHITIDERSGAPTIGAGRRLAMVEVEVEAALDDE